MEAPTVVAFAVTSMLAAGVASSTAWAEGGPGVVVDPGDPSGQYGSPSIGLGATSPGRPGGSGGQHAGPRHGGSGAGPSEESGQSGPSLPSLPSWCPNASCSADMGPTPGGPPLPLPGGNGYLCALPQNQGLCPILPPAPPGAPSPPGGPPSPAVLAQQAVGQLRLPVPAPAHSPNLRLHDGRAATLVGEHIWFWTNPADWHPYNQRVQAGPVWAEVTASPVRLSMQPGNGTAPVSCPGPGTPYQRQFGVHARSPDCDVVYTHSSLGQPGGQTTAGWAITWQVTWRGGLGPAPAEGGALPVMTSRAQARFAVAEAQSLRTH